MLTLMKKKLLITAAVSGSLFFSLLLFQLLIPLPVGIKNTEIEIPKGATFRQVADILSDHNLLRNKTLFLVLGRITGIERTVRAGYYSLYESMNTLDLLSALSKGQIIEYEITVIEGDSLWEIADKLSGKGIVSRNDFLKLSEDRRILTAHTIDAPSVEGYLFPDTYKIPKGMIPEDVLRMMITRMREKFTDELAERAGALGLSEREVLTLASIIEKEAASDHERSLISAVYHNRLRRGIPLQADPTAIYGVKSSREKITAADLRNNTPYNTYVIRGLPPGPIASPGMKSITAALNPAYVPYIYFVSNNDGTHQFSVTALEHQAAVDSYREKKQKEKEMKEKTNDTAEQEVNGDR